MQKTLVALKKSETENRVLFRTDECGVCLLPFCAKTWAPKGQTPVLHEFKSREHLNLFGMISTQGDLCWQIQRLPFKAEDFEAFFTWLSTEGLPNTQMLVVWDGASIHKGQPVKAFLQNNPGSIHLEALPPYCPQLNAEVSPKRQLVITKGDKKLHPRELFGIWQGNPRTLEQLRSEAWKRNWNI